MNKVLAVNIARSYCSIAKSKLKTLITEKSKVILMTHNNRNRMSFSMASMTSQKAEILAKEFYAEYSRIVDDLILLSKENGDLILSSNEYRMLKELIDGK